MHAKTVAWILAVLLFAALGALGYGAYQYIQFRNDTAETIGQYEDKIAVLESKTKNALDTIASIQDAYLSTKSENKDIANQLDTFDKLSKLDPELLAKYSKVYFLNENYKPSSLSKIPDAYTFHDGKDYQFHSKALPFLEALIDAARQDGINLEIVSAYRSFSEQADLKSSYRVTYGSGANAFSADQGYSEHQLGTAVDFTTKELNGGLDGFDKTDAYEWLTDHAHQYGFVLSYPSGNSYYVYEPWHWRFVGKELAQKLHQDGEHFYDLDQREISGYLLHIFDR